MRYPDDFDTKTSDVGRRLAVARKMAIYAMFVFVLIIFSCILLIWANKSVKIHPFLISINNITGQWELVGHQHEKIAELSTDYTLQEAVIGKLIRSWFLLTKNKKRNREAWQKCNRAESCDPSKKTGIESGRCSIYCLTGSSLHEKFVANVMPDYLERMGRGESFFVDMATLQMKPLGDFKDPKGCTWQVRFNIKTMSGETETILGYAVVLRDMPTYPQTMGYYISDFYSYKIEK